LRNPLKLGELSESELRHEVRRSEWVAKTWRYFVSRGGLRVFWIVPLVVPLVVPLGLGWLACAPVPLRLTGCGGISMAVAMVGLVIVEVDVAMAAERGLCGSIRAFRRGRSFLKCCVLIWAGDVE
jgi:hypothetical protein